MLAQMATTAKMMMLTCVDTLTGTTPLFFASELATNLLSKLSTALCVGAVIRNLDWGSSFNNCVMITTIVCVFPVPGGPQMKVNDCFIEAVNAAFWLRFSDGTRVTGSSTPDNFI